MPHPPIARWLLAVHPALVRAPYRGAMDTGRRAVRTGTAAWVESPLQLLGALEHAALSGTGPLTIVPRAGDAQLERTAAHLADRAAGDPAIEARIALDRRVMPPRMFGAGEAWLIGDAYSGQVQARLDRVEPGTITLVDDGAITRLLAEQLRTGAPVLRPRPPRLLRGLRHELAARTTRRLRRLAAEGRLALTTFLRPDDAAVATLRALGVAVLTHDFDVTRRWGHAAASVPRGASVVLGSARVVDGLVDAGSALEGIRRLAASGPVAYLPHRREPRWFLTAVGRVPGVAVVTPRVPIELALAGADHPVTVIAGETTAAETLPIVLRGTGSVVVRPPVVPEVAR